MAHETQYASLMYNFGMTYSVPRGTNQQLTPTTPKNECKKPTRINARLANITHGRALDHVPHGETLDRLVFGDAPRAVGAADETNVTAVFLVTTAVSSLLGLSNGGG